MNTPTFDTQPPEGGDRIPHRPLGSLSTYVALDLGDDLKAVASQQLSPQAFTEKCRTLSQNAAKALQLLQTPEETAVAHLDVLLLPQALQTIGREQPTELRTLIHAMLSKDTASVPMLTYEDIVLQNPADDPRIFTRGDIGRSEFFFYDIHRQIEREMTHIRALLFPMLLRQTRFSFTAAAFSKYPPHKEIFPQEVDDCCTDVLPHLSRVRASMQLLLDELNPVHFAAFRPYFSPRVDPEYGQLPGPSGNFSAGMYCFDNLCIGRQPLMQELNTAKDADLRFFPKTETAPPLYETQEHMRDVKGYIGLNGFTLDDCSMDYARENCIRVMDAMREIREIHLRIFGKFIGSGRGTALKLPEYLTLAPRAYAQTISDLQ